MARPTIPLGMPSQLKWPPSPLLVPPLHPGERPLNIFAQGYSDFNAKMLGLAANNEEHRDD
jgi:hypothetical protein